jgi:hypothetical protein
MELLVGRAIRATRKISMKTVEGTYILSGRGITEVTWYTSHAGSYTG